LRNILNFISNSGLLLNLICGFIKNYRLVVVRLRIINVLIIGVWLTIFGERCFWLVFYNHFLIIIFILLLIIFRIIIYLILASIFLVFQSLNWLFLKYLNVLLRITIFHLRSFPWVYTLHIRQRSINLVSFLGIHNSRIPQSARINYLRSILKLILIILCLLLLILPCIIILLSLLKIVLIFINLLIFSVIGSLIIWSSLSLVRIAYFFNRIHKSWVNSADLRFFQLWSRIRNLIICKLACFLFFCSKLKMVFTYFEILLIIWLVFVSHLKIIIIFFH
jgi:hypothetical protein